MSTETYRYPNSVETGGVFTWNNYQHQGNNGIHLGPFQGQGVGSDVGGPKRRSRSAKMTRNSKKDWVPATKLGRLVKNGYISTLDEIFRYNVTITEVEIVDYLTKGQLHEEVFTVFPVTKQTAQGTRTRFKVLAVVGDKNGHVGLGIKCYKEVASAIRGAFSNAKLAMIQVLRGRWLQETNRVVPNGLCDKSELHTIAGKVSGESGGTKIRLLPAPRGVGIVGAMTADQTTLLSMAGIKDCFVACSQSSGTSHAGNQVKATLNALQNLSRLKNEPEETEKVSSTSSDDPDLNWRQQPINPVVPQPIYHNNMMFSPPAYL